MSVFSKHIVMLAVICLALSVPAAPLASAEEAKYVVYQGSGFTVICLAPGFALCSIAGAFAVGGCYNGPFAVEVCVSAGAGAVGAATSAGAFTSGAAGEVNGAPARCTFNGASGACVEVMGLVKLSCHAVEAVAQSFTASGAVQGVPAEKRDASCNASNLMPSIPISATTPKGAECDIKQRWDADVMARRDADLQGIRATFGLGPASLVAPVLNESVAAFHNHIDLMWLDEDYQVHLPEAPLDVIIAPARPDPPSPPFVGCSTT